MFDNTSKIGIEAVYNSIGVTLINTQRAARREFSKSNPSEKAKNALLRLWDFCKEAKEAIELTDMIIQKGPQVLENVQNFLRIRDG